MPRNKSISHYPARYPEIVRECALAGQEVRLAVADRKQALSLRGHWFSFVGSIKAEGQRVTRQLALLPTGLPSTAQQEILDLVAYQPMVMLTIEEREGQVFVVWQNREQSWQARLLATATVTAGKPTAMTAEQDAIGQRLLTAQQEKDDAKNR